jgi:WD40 repeat protein
MPEARGHEAMVTTVAFAPNGRQLASGSEDGVVMVQDLATRVLQWKTGAHRRSVSGLAYCSGGDLLASAGQDGHVRLSDAKIGRLVWDWECCASGIDAMAWSREAELLAVACHNGYVRIRRLSSDRDVLAFESKEWISSLAFLRAGTLLAAGNHRGTVTVWTVRR